MRSCIALLIALAAAAALVPDAAAHSCSSSRSCGPCVEGEDHAHSDPSGSCVSYEDGGWPRGGASASWDEGNGRAEANFTPGAGALGALAAIGVAAAALAGRREK